MGKRRDHNRIGRTALTLLLSVVMTITFMPAWAFAVTETPATQGETTAAAEEAQAGNEDINANTESLSETPQEDASEEDAEAGGEDTDVQEDAGASDEDEEDVIAPEPATGSGSVTVSGETDRGEALLLNTPDAKSAGKADGAPDDRGDGSDEFPFYEYSLEEGNRIYSDGYAALELNLPDGEEPPEYASITQLRVGVAVLGGEFPDWVIDFARDGNLDAFTFTDRTLSIEIYGDNPAVKRALEYHHIDVFVEASDTDGKIVWAAGGSFNYEEPEYDYHLDSERDMLVYWDGSIKKNDNKVYVENAENPDGREFDYEVVSAVSSDPSVVSVRDDGDHYYYQALSEGDAVITVKCSSDDIELPDGGIFEMNIHVGEHVFSADIWPVNGSYNALPGGTIELEGYAEDTYKETDPDSDESFDVNDPIAGDRFIWTVEDGGDVVDELIPSDDGKRVTVRFKSYDEIAAGDDHIDRGARISLKVNDGDNTIVYRDVWLRVSSGYAEISPTAELAALADMDVGESRKITLEAKEYSANGTGSGSSVIQGAEFNWEYDNNCAEIKGSGNTFTITRKGDGDGFFKVRAEWGEGDGHRETEYQARFRWKNYHCWFENDDKPLFSDGDKILTLNTDSLDGAGISDPVIEFAVRRQKDGWNEEDDPEGKNRWDILENPIFGDPLYTVSGKTITLHGAALLDELGEDGDINVAARIRLSSDTEYALNEPEEWIFVREAWIDWEREYDRDMLPGWDGDIHNSYHVEVENAQHPDREGSEYRVSGVKVISGAEFLEDGCVDNDGNLRKDINDNDETDYWWHYRIKDHEDIDDLSDARVTFKVLVEENEWGIEDYEFNLNIGKDVFNVDIESEGERYNGLPGSEFELTARGRHEYLDDRNEYHNDNVGLGYEWSLDENGSDFAVITPDNADPSKAALRFKDLPEGEDRINEDVRVVVKMTFDGNEVSDNESNFRVMSRYEEIWPLGLDRSLDKGSTIDMPLELRRYDLSDDSGDEYILIDDAEFEFDFDQDALSIGNENGDIIEQGERYPAGLYKITKKEDWGTDLNVRAFWKDGNEDRDIDNHYHFDENDYHLDFEYDAGDVFTDGNTEIRLNTGRLGDDWAEKYSVSFKVGKGDWKGDEEGYVWDTEFDRGTEYTVDPDEPSVTLLGDALTSYANDRILIVYQLKSKYSGAVLSEDDFGVTIREPWLDADFPQENVDLLRGWDCYIDGRIGYRGGNSQNHEFGGEYIVQSVTYKNGPDAASDGVTKIEARPAEDDQGQGRIDWSIRVLDDAAPGSSSAVRLTYIDSEDGSEPPQTQTYDFTVHVVDDIYEVTIDSVDGKFQEFPGGTIELRAYGLHKFTRDNDDGEGWHYEESQEGLDYEWELENNSIATLTQHSDDASRATLKFNDDIEDEAGTGVTVRLKAGGNEVTSGFDFFSAASEYPEVQPATIPSDLDIGETTEIEMKTVLKEKGADDREIQGAEYVWNHNENDVCIEAVGDNGEVSVIHSGENSRAKNIRITRLTERYVRFSLRSEWGPRAKWHAYYLDPIECSIDMDAPDNTDITMNGDETGTFHFITKGFDSKGVEYEPKILVFNESIENFEPVEGLSAEDVTVSKAEGGLDVKVRGEALLEKDVDRFHILVFAKVNGNEVRRSISRPIHVHKWGEWAETPATYDEPGKKTRECAGCHETEEEPFGKSLKEDAEDKIAAAAQAAQDAETAMETAKQKLKDAEAAAATPGDAAVEAAQAAKTAADAAKKAADDAKAAADEAKTAAEAAQAKAPADKTDEAAALVTNASNLVTRADTLAASAATAVTDAETAVTKAGSARDAADQAAAAAKAKAEADAKAAAAAKAEAERLARDGVLDKKIPKVKISKPAVKKNTITAKWKKLTKKQLKKSKAKKYEIWVCPNKKFAKEDTKEKIVSKSKSSYKFKGLRKKTKYYVKVRAIRYAGGTKYVGKWSKVKSIKTK